MKQESKSDIWFSTVGDDVSDECLGSLDFPDCSSRPKTNVVNKDSLHSKGGTDVLPVLPNKSKV